MLKNIINFPILSKKKKKLIYILYYVNGITINYSFIFRILLFCIYNKFIIDFPNLSKKEKNDNK